MRLKVDVIVTYATPPVIAAKQAPGVSAIGCAGALGGCDAPTRRDRDVAGGTDHRAQPRPQCRLERDRRRLTGRARPGGRSTRSVGYRIARHVPESGCRCIKSSEGLVAPGVAPT